MSSRSAIAAILGLLSTSLMAAPVIVPQPPEDPSPPDISLLSGAPRASRLSSGILRQLSAEFRAIYDAAAPSVVVVESPPLDSFSGSWDDRGETASPALPESDEMMDTASGILFRPPGYILTNHHVIQNVLSDFVRVKLFDGRVVFAKIVGSDPKTDIAVLLLPEAVTKDNPPPAMRQGDSDAVSVGDLVFALGAPYGLEYSLSMGIVSGRGRNPLTFSAYEDYIQTDAAINPGNSGGPLLNLEGEWVGMNTLMNGINRGLGFAIPATQATAIADRLIKEGEIKRPWVGIRLRPRAPLAFGEEGVEVTAVEKDSPAERAGLKVGDRVVTANGVLVQDPSTLQKKIWETGVGGTLKLETLRGRSLRTRVIKPEETPMPWEPAPPRS